MSFLSSVEQPGQSPRVQLQLFCCLIFFNVLYFIIGLACEITSAYIGIAYRDKVYSIAVDTDSINAIVIVTAVLGLALFIMTIYGCYAYSKRFKSSVILFTKMHLLLFIIVIVVSIVIFLLSSQKSLSSPTSIHHLDKYGQPGFEQYTSQWDELQIVENCCGIQSCKDWKIVPDSCCVSNWKGCTTNVSDPTFNSKGCFDVARESLSSIYYIVSSILLLVGIFLGFGLFFSIPVCRFTVYYQHINVHETHL
ncbi:CD63 antigen-like [Anneissia japonica]|uniref:CD63 antigen-like n=1 Tax=Anneissia japonica TaxID=1529436 RepID=UPI0014257A29|nr:CD63 antigen-like [Anneissia japonica]